MSSRHPRREVDNRIPRARSVANYQILEEPVCLSKFSFHGTDKQVLLSIEYTLGSFTKNSRPPCRRIQPMEAPPSRKVGEAEQAHRGRNATSTAGTLNFAKSGITGRECSITSMISGIHNIPGILHPH